VSECGRAGRWVRSGAALGLTLALSLVSASASAQQLTKDQCIEANTRAQHLRTDGKLSESRELLRKCADPACPAIIRSDCTKRIDELQTVQPTIAFDVKDASGAAVSAVKVTVDGKLLADKLDGTALPVDPGQHDFTFEAQGQPVVRRTLIVIEGVKARREVIVLGSADGTVPAPPPPPPPAPLVTEKDPFAHEAPASATPSGVGMGTQKLLGLIAGGVGVAGIAVGGVFGAMTISEKNKQVDACGSACSPAAHAQGATDHSNALTDGTISTVAFIAGGALLVGGAVLFFTAAPSSQQPTTGFVVAPSVGPGGGGVLLRGDF
jgi:hypothetical protein